MERQPVAAKRIRSAGYDAVCMLFEVEATTGAIYHFHNVPSSVGSLFASASSREQFISEHIAGVFQSTKVREEAPEVRGWHSATLSLRVLPQTKTA